MSHSAKIFPKFSRKYEIKITRNTAEFRFAKFSWPPYVGLLQVGIIQCRELDAVVVGLQVLPGLHVDLSPAIVDQPTGSRRHHRQQSPNHSSFFRVRKRPTEPMVVFAPFFTLFRPAAAPLAVTQAFFAHTSRRADNKDIRCCTGSFGTMRSRPEDAAPCT